jgi:hypothetical protein
MPPFGESKTLAERSPMITILSETPNYLIATSAIGSRHSDDHTLEIKPEPDGQITAIKAWFKTVGILFSWNRDL